MKKNNNKILYICYFVITFVISIGLGMNAVKFKDMLQSIIQLVTSVILFYGNIVIIKNLK